METNRLKNRNDYRRPIQLLALTALLLALIAVKPAEASLVFDAHLDGSQEVPPNNSIATGFASFQFNAAMTTLSYELNVFDIDDVTAAHIHLAPAGQNGQVVAFLFGPDPGTGPINGLLASGTIVAADLVGPLQGFALTDLRAQMAAGNTYVNVHTLPFPAGEIRGQIESVPEPAGLALFGLGLAGLWFARRRRAA